MEHLKSPSLKQLHNILKPEVSGVATRWYDLGVQLLNSTDTGVLDIIKADHPNDVSTCCNEMFKKWLEIQHDASWNQLVIALNKIGLNSMADDINKMIRKEKPCSETAESSSANMMVTPDEASAEFAILMKNIIKELKKDETKYLEDIKDTCAYLTVKGNPNVFLFNEDQQEAITACDNIRTLFTRHLRGCWRFDDFPLLKKIIQSINSRRCEEMLNQYEEKLNISMKLQDIHEHCKQEKQAFPEGYHKMVAIVENKIYSRITKEEYDELKEFISKHCEVEEYFLSPFYKAAPSSLMLEWFVSATVVTHMVESATRNKDVFIKNSFVYLSISSHVIFDERNYIDGFTPLHLAAENGHVEVVETLIKSEADIDSVQTDGWTSLLIGAQNGHVEVVETLIESGADVNIVEKDGWSALHLAAQNGHVEVVETLIKSGADVSIVEKDEYTPLHLAAQNGHDDVVETLIKSKAGIDVVENNGYTPLYLAAKNGHVKVIETLIESGANIDGFQKDGWISLHIAVQNGHVKVIKTLIKSGANINTAGKDGWTPLHIVAQYSHIEVVQTLIKSGADINAVQQDGWTPLHVATQNGHVKVVEILKKSGADTNTVGNDKRTSLHNAVQNGNVKEVENLIKSGTDINVVRSGWTPLHLAAQIGYVEIVKILIKTGADINAVGEDTFSPLHLAAQNCYVEVVETLVRAGANINAVNKTKWTPLHFAVKNDHSPLVETLISLGADVDAATDSGDTALHFASRDGHYNIVQLLTKAGADVTIINKEKRTPLLEAMQHQQKSVVHCFMEEIKVDITHLDKSSQKWIQDHLEKWKIEQQKSLVPPPTKKQRPLDEDGKNYM